MITRAQIRRQLRQNGGIMNVIPRQGYRAGSIGGGIIQGIPMGSRTGYGIFSKLKSGVKKFLDPAIDVVTNVAKSPVGKAAILGLGGAGLMGMGPLSGLGGIGAKIGGSGIGQFVKGMGPALFGGGALPPSQGLGQSIGLLGKLGKIAKSPLGMIGGASLLTYFMQKGATEEEAEDLVQDVYRGKGLGMDQIRADMKKYRSGALSASQAHDMGYHFLTPQTYLGAQGGRVGLKKGSPHGKTDKEVLKELYPTLFSDTTTSIEGAPKKKKHTKGKKDGGRIGYQTGGLLEPEWYAEEVEKQRQHWDPTWGPFLMPESWEEMEEPAKVHMMKELGPYYEHKYANPVEPTPTTGGGGGFLGSRIRPADNITSSSTEPTEGLGAIIMEARNRAATPEAPASVSMGQTLQQNIAANQAQQMRNQSILEAGRQRLPQQVAQGGRIGFAHGDVPWWKFWGGAEKKIGQRNLKMIKAKQQSGLDLTDEEKAYLKEHGESKAQGGRIGYKDGTPKVPENLPTENYLKELEEFLKKRKEYEKRRMMAPTQEAAQGGRIGKYGGGIGTAMPRIPTGMPRVNAGGITELDYRQEGGFVPMGVKEKADDVPAMLSKNEFVMTADAVKAAGGGNVEKGAQRMYNTMKQLENRIA